MPTRLSAFCSASSRRAGVVEDDLRVAVLLDELVAERVQLTAHQLAVELVHLAAEGLQIDAHAWWSREDTHYGRETSSAKGPEITALGRTSPQDGPRSSMFSVPCNRTDGQKWRVAVAFT
jgi:hypothetical protein